MNLPNAALVPVLIGMIAAIVSLLGLVISKETKLSEFRQSWIDGLRNDLAALISHAYSAEAVFRLAANEKDPKKQWEMLEPTYRPLNEMVARIKLRLNPMESDPVLLPIKRLENALEAGAKALQHGVIREIDDEIIAQSQKILKGAWLVVRDGEGFHRRVRTGSIVLLFITFALAIYLGFRPTEVAQPVVPSGPQPSASPSHP